jgi:DNA-binding PucR family transcriptional regulator
VLPPETISATNQDGTVVAVVPDAGAPTRRAQLERALAGHVAAIGPVVPWTDATRSARRARAAHRLAVDEVLPGARLIATDRHLSELLLHSDPSLLAELSERALAPLAHRTPAARRRLADTLRALLDHQGSAPDAAAALHVHPQTVRYRLAQLREDFGDVLDDPDCRFELALALRA